jgi:hypothetical protein
MSISFDIHLINRRLSMFKLLAFDLFYSYIILKSEFLSTQTRVMFWHRPRSSMHFWVFNGTLLACLYATHFLRKPDM